MSQAAFPVSTIQSRVITLCDLPATLDTTTSPTAAAMLDLIKVAFAMASGIMGSEYSDEMYFTTTGTVTTTADQSTVSLSTLTGLSNVQRVVWVRNGTEEIELVKASLDMMSASPSVWDSASSTPVAYRVMGDSSLELYPTPDAVYTLKLHYSTGLYPTTTASTFYCRDGWDQWITLQTCILVRARQQKDATDFMVALEKLEAALRRQIKRDRNGVSQVRDHRGSLFTRPRRW